MTPRLASNRDTGRGGVTRFGARRGAWLPGLASPCAVLPTCAACRFPGWLPRAPGFTTCGFSGLATCGLPVPGLASPCAGLYHVRLLGACHVRLAGSRACFPVRRASHCAACRFPGLSRRAPGFPLRARLPPELAGARVTPLEQRSTDTTCGCAARFRECRRACRTRSLRASPCAVRRASHLCGLPVPGLASPCAGLYHVRLLGACLPRGLPGARVTPLEQRSTDTTCGCAARFRECRRACRTRSLRASPCAVRRASHLCGLPVPRAFAPCAGFPLRARLPPGACRRASDAARAAEHGLSRRHSRKRAAQPRACRTRSLRASPTCGFPVRRASASLRASRVRSGLSRLRRLPTCAGLPPGACRHTARPARGRDVPQLAKTDKARHVMMKGEKLCCTSAE
jgi:hypothetical protein